MITREFTNSTQSASKTSRELATFEDRHGLRPQKLELEFSIRAETRRLFHALTLPEYMEAWMSFPDRGPGANTMVTMLSPDYLVEHHCEGYPPIYISGSYSVLQRHNLVFSWRMDGGPEIQDSLVDIRLRGDFGRTTLQLQHLNLSSEHDREWHRSFWLASIARLIGLYESPVY